MKKPKRKKRKSRKMLKRRRINKKATIQNVMDWVLHQSSEKDFDIKEFTEKNFDIKKFNDAMMRFRWERKLVAFAKDRKIKIVYC